MLTLWVELNNFPKKSDAPVNSDVHMLYTFSHVSYMFIYLTFCFTCVLHCVWCVLCVYLCVCVCVRLRSLVASGDALLVLLLSRSVYFALLLIRECVLNVV